MRSDRFSRKAAAAVPTSITTVIDRELIGLCLILLLVIAGSQLRPSAEEVRPPAASSASLNTTTTLER